MCLTFEGFHNDYFYNDPTIICTCFHLFSYKFLIFALAYSSLGKRMGVKQPNRLSYLI